MATDLSNLKLDEIAFVDEGANKGAHITLFKRAEPSEPEKKGLFKRLLEKFIGTDDARTFDEVQDFNEARQDLWQLFDALQDSVMSIAADDTVDDKQGMIQESMDQFNVALRATFSGIGKMVSKHNPGERPMDMKELEEKFGKLEEQVATLTTDNEALTKRADEADAALKVSEEALKKAKEGTADDDANDDDIDKSKLPANVVEALEKGEKLNARVDKMEDEARTTEFNKKAEGYPNLVGTTENLGAILKSANGAMKDDEFTALEAALKAADEAMGKAFIELGKGGAGNENSAWDQIVDKGAEISKRDGITKEKGIEMAKAENPDLMKQYKEEKTAKH